jgi:hypothetical protein
MQATRGVDVENNDISLVDINPEKRVEEETTMSKKKPLRPVQWFGYLPSLGKQWKKRFFFFFFFWGWFGCFFLEIPRNEKAIEKIVWFEKAGAHTLVIEL